MYLIKADKQNILKNGFNDLTDVLKENSEDTVFKSLEESIKGLSLEDFCSHFFDEKDKKGNEKKLEFAYFKPLMEYIKQDATKYCDIFYKKCLINDEISCEPKEKIFNQAIDKFGIKLLDKIDEKFFDIITSDDFKKKYLIDKKEPREKKYDDDTEKLLDKIEDGKIVSFLELSKSNEPVGTDGIETTKLDVGFRDYPIVVLDKTIFIKGGENDTHTQAIYKYSKKHKKDEKFEKVNKDLKAKEDNDNDLFYRDEGEDALTEADFKSFAFGHVKNNMAFIDSTMGCDVDEIKDLVKRKTHVKKVYDSTMLGKNPHTYNNRRVARLIPLYNVELHNMAIQEIKKIK